MRLLRTLLAMLAVFVVLPAGARAAADTFTVNSTADAHDANVGDGSCVAEAPASGKCTLRAAIEEAAENGNDTIVDLPAGTYALQFSSLFINANVDIRGAGAATTIIDGSGMDDSNGPIFGGSEFSLTLQDLTVTKGRNGAVDGSIA